MNKADTYPESLYFSSIRNDSRHAISGLLEKSRANTPSMTDLHIRVLTLADIFLEIDDRKPIPKLAKEFAEYALRAYPERSNKLNLKPFNEEPQRSQLNYDKDSPEGKEFLAFVKVCEATYRFAQGVTGRPSFEPVKQGFHRIPAINLSTLNEIELLGSKHTIMPELFYDIMGTTKNWNEEAIKVDQAIEAYKSLEVDPEPSEEHYQVDQVDRTIWPRQAGYKIYETLGALCINYMTDNYPYYAKSKRKDQQSIFTHASHERKITKDYLSPLMEAIIAGKSIDGDALYRCPSISEAIEYGRKLQDNPVPAKLNRSGRWLRRPKLLGGFKECHPLANKHMLQIAGTTADLDAGKQGLIPYWVGNPDVLPCHMQESQQYTKPRFPKTLEPVETLFHALGVDTIIRKAVNVEHSHTITGPISPSRAFNYKFSEMLRLEELDDYPSFEKDLAAYRKKAQSQWPELNDKVDAWINHTPTQAELREQAAFLQERTNRLQELGLHIAEIQEVIDLTNAVTQTTAAQVQIDDAKRNLLITNESPAAEILASTVALEELSGHERKVAVAALKHGADEGRLFADQLPQRHANWDIIQEMHGKVHHQLEEACTEALDIIDELIEFNYAQPEQAQRLMQLRECIHETGEQAEPLIRRLQERQNHLASARG